MKANAMFGNASQKWTLIWHGCEVRQLATSGQHGVSMELSVACVKAPDGTEGYLKGVLLNWPQATWQTDVPLNDILGGVADGHWFIDGAMHKTMLIPCTCASPHTLSLRLISGTELCVQSHECQITVAPDAQFQESMAC
jgi:hypothetical protein